MTGSARHKWDGKVRFEHKTEQQCTRCEMVKATFHQWEPAGDVYWTEFWRDGEKVEHAATPPCDARLERETAANLEGVA